MVYNAVWMQTAESFITDRSSFIQGIFSNEGLRGSKYNGQQGWREQLEGQNHSQHRQGKKDKVKGTI
jgi:hypothetical protein